MFASFPLGSAVVVQQEDGGPWTHGMVVNTGDHNQAYTIQLTTNGRQISREVANEDNRQKTLNTPGDKTTIPQNGKIIKTRSRHIIKKPDSHTHKSQVQA